jgi:hypothetical protein
MPQMPEGGRQAAHVLLDTVSAYDPELADDAKNSAAMDRAFQRMNDVGAVSGTIDDATDVVTLEVSPLLGGTIVSMHWLVTQLAHHKGTTREDVIFALREYLDDDSR